MNPHKKVAVVTGAARGIGLAIAKRFLEEGYAVALVDIDGAELAKADSTLGDDTMAIVCDVADPRQVRAAVDEVTARFGRIDALVNNAGIAVFNLVAPGPVDTAMAKLVHTEDIRADYHDAIPLNRYGLEEEIAAAVWFLCSDAASYVNGQALAVDGGFDAAGIGLPSLRNK